MCRESGPPKVTLAGCLPDIWKATKELCTFLVHDELRERQRKEALNTSGFTDRERAIESQIEEYLKPYP